MKSRQSTIDRQTSIHHEKTIMLEIKIKKHLEGIVRHKPKNCPLKLNQQLSRNNYQYCRLSYHKLNQQIRELQQICSSMKTRPPPSKIININTNNDWIKLKELRKQLKRKTHIQPLPPPRNELFGNAIQYENINRLSRFIEGGYLQEEEDDNQTNFNAIGLTHQRFCSLSKMYNVVKDSRQFQQSLANSIEPPKDSLANYVYRCEKLALWRGEQRHAKAASQQSPSFLSPRKQQVTQMKKKNRKRHFKRKSMDTIARYDQQSELLESIKLMRRNITERDQ